MLTHRPALRSVAVHRDEPGTVVAARDVAVRAGLSMYEAGGNAVDAAVAAALVSGVVEPAETTLAGSGFLLVHDPEHGPISWEFGPRAPRRAHAEMFRLAANRDAGVVALTATEGMRNLNGPLANGVPRTLLGLLTAQERWGRLDRRTVTKPAIAAAHDGFEADSWFVTSAMADLQRLLKDPQARHTFLSDGVPIGSRGDSELGLAAGRRALVTQPALGRTLEIVTRDVSALVDGEIAGHLVATSRERGGILTEYDLAAAGPEAVPPRTLMFRDHEVHVPRAPSGGLTVLQILALWDRLTADAPDVAVGDRFRELALVVRHSFADRYHWLADPDVVPVPENGLLDPRYLDSLVALVSEGKDVEGWREGLPWATYAARAIHNPWGEESREGVPRWIPQTATAPTSGTTHVSAADADGRTVAITHTAAHHFGSGIMCPRTGLLFDAAMAWFNAAPGAANSIEGHKRPVANMAPVLLSRDGKGLAALGASGGRRIVSANAQLVIALVASTAGRMEPAERVEAALTAPRLDASGPLVQLEAGIADALESVGDLGARVIPAVNDPFVMDVARPNIAMVGHPAADAPTTTAAGTGASARDRSTAPASGIPAAAYSH
ncbi:gamma-glutamyltransferase [Streptomyces malaysiensis]|uniref:gamma-glutamyltransferase n=1 Tax=Streptomyces malaysiensis TaxID=92644 RepID=UPI002814C5BD|nr:gamma-glutamyltransferase [Streptomyces samsunensis]